MNFNIPEDGYRLMLVRLLSRHLQEVRIVWKAREMSVLLLVEPFREKEDSA